MQLVKKNNIENIPLEAKASIAFFTANIVQKGMGYLTTPIYTRILSADEFGKASLFMVWMNILGIFAMFRLSAGVFNNGMTDYPNKRMEYSLSMLILSNMITLICGCLILFPYKYLYNLIKIDKHLIMLMFILFFVEPAYEFWATKNRYEYYYKMPVFFSILIATIPPIISIIAIHYSKNRLYGRIYGAYIPLLILYACFYVYLLLSNRCRIEKKYWKYALKFNIPLIPHYLSIYFLNAADRIMISMMIDDSATAYYSVAYSVAAVITIVWSAINAALIPFTYENCKQKQFRKINDVIIPLLIIYGIGCLFIILLAPELLAFLGNDKYKDAVYVIPPIVGGTFFQALYYVYANIIYYYKKPKYVMYASVTAMVINIILNYLFIPIFGYFAAGYTTLFCYLLQAIMDYFAMCKTVKNYIFNREKIIILSLCVLFISIIGDIVYQYIFFRYFLLLFIVVLFVFYGKSIVSVFDILRRGEKDE